MSAAKPSKLQPLHGGDVDSEDSPPISPMPKPPATRKNKSLASLRRSPAVRKTCNSIRILNSSSVDFETEGGGTVSEVTVDYLVTSVDESSPTCGRSKDGDASPGGTWRTKGHVSSQLRTMKMTRSTSHVRRRRARHIGRLPLPSRADSRQCAYLSRRTSTHSACWIRQDFDSFDSTEGGEAPTTCVISMQISSSPKAHSITQFTPTGIQGSVDEEIGAEAEASRYDQNAIDENIMVQSGCTDSTMDASTDEEHEALDVFDADRLDSERALEQEERCLKDKANEAIGSADREFVESVVLQAAPHRCSTTCHVNFPRGAT